MRRSVANNLNDIAKDHPDLVAEIAERWMQDASKNRVRLVKHACRTLIKAGHAGALEALGYGAAKVALADLSVATPVVQFGDALEFSARLVSEADEVQPVIVDYVIHHVKADGGRTPKVFKLKVAELPGSGTLALNKRHAIKPITTRVYYGGMHRVEIQVNGTVIGGAEFELKMP